LKHTSALVVIPPRAVWDAVQEVRCVRDKSYLRWMPHVNLLYPFLEDDASGETFADAAAIAADALKDTSPFRCSLRAFAFFEHKRSATVWLHPSQCPGVDEAFESAKARRGVPEREARDDFADAARDFADEPGSPVFPPVNESVLSTQRALERAFPFANHLSTISSAGFTPHLSVGQWPDAVSASAAVANLRAGWRPVDFDVDAVFLISRPSDGSGPFRVRARVPLGGGEPEVFETETETETGAEAKTPSAAEWFREPYAPHAPPLGARCLVPKRARGRGARRARNEDAETETRET
jgi:poly(A) polymerase